jgi:hypothetical protein
LSENARFTFKYTYKLYIYNYLIIISPKKRILPFFHGLVSFGFWLQPSVADASEATSLRVATSLGASTTSGGSVPQLAMVKHV